MTEQPSTPTPADSLQDALSTVAASEPRFTPEGAEAVTITVTGHDPIQLAAGHAMDLSYAIRRQETDRTLRAELGEIVDRIATVLVAERRENPACDVGDLLCRALWDAAMALGHHPVARMEGGKIIPPPPPDRFDIGAGAMRLIRGRPGSWEAALVLDWTKEGRGIKPAGLHADRLGELTSHLAELGRWFDPVPDGGELLSQALGQAVTELGSMRAFTGDSWLTPQLENLGGQHADVSDGLWADGGDA